MQLNTILIEITGKLSSIVQSFHRARPMKAAIKQILLEMIKTNLMPKLKEVEEKKAAKAKEVVVAPGNAGGGNNLKVNTGM